MPRESPDGHGVEALALLRPGVDVRLIDVSPHGALLEGVAACRPGTRTELTLSCLDGRRHVATCRVVRSAVVALAPLRFHIAVVFERQLDLRG